MKNIFDILNKSKKEIKNAYDINQLNKIKSKFLGKNSYLQKEIQIISNFSREKYLKVIKVINIVKKKIKDLIFNKKKKINKNKIIKKLSFDEIDVSLPGRFVEKNIGSIHPISETILKIEKYFSNLGYSIVNSFEIEDEYYNFTALNIDKNHPARNMHDTLWFDNNRLLRSQTSGVQIRIMQSYAPPFQIISSGRVYRNDYDSNHTPMFHQIEGFHIDKFVSFSYLKDLLYSFLDSFFSKNVRKRFRVSYFPFTEPSAEIDIIGNNKSWIEVLGCGIIHPKILFNMGIDTKKFFGIAFGIGIERLAMIYYGVSDIRSFFENDLFFLKQFK